MAWTPKQFSLSGGVNERDPQWQVNAKNPGALAFSRNYECVSGSGYKRMAGYERYDTQTSPTTATYKWFAFSTGSVQPTDQMKVIGGTSGAVGYVCGLTEVTGVLQWSSGFAQGKVALVVTSGTFQDNEWLEKFSDNSHLCKLTSTANDGADSDDSWASWIEGARTYYRNLITKVPGFGSVLGVFMLNGYVYAWRATVADHTKQALYKATGGAWSLQTLTGYILFNTATIEILEGDTITGGSSGATAIVRRVSVGGGTYAGPSYANGRFAITNITGTFTNGEDLKVGGVTRAKAGGTQVTAAVMTATSARHQTRYYNFYGASDLKRIYGCDGVNAGYEFDGTYFINIETNMTSNVPKHIEVFSNTLFFAFAGGSLQNSGTGTPLVWSVRTGATEIGLGDEPTGLGASGVALCATAASTVKILTGSSNQDWLLKSVKDAAGSLPYTIQETGGQTLFLDRAGVNILIPPPPIGSQYSTQSVSALIKKTVRDSASLVTDSLYCTLKNQYRLYFSDKTGIIATYEGNRLQGWTQQKYAHQLTCSIEGADTSGNLRQFAGTTDGYVVELDVGSSWDGEDIESIAQLPFGYFGSPDRDKRFHKLTVEIDTPRAVRLYYAIDFEYGASQQPGRYIGLAGNTSPLSSFALFGELFWATNVLSSAEENIDGVARSIGIALYHNSAVDDSFTLTAALLQFTVLGVKR
jgi:hypothetical protein